MAAAYGCLLKIFFTFEMFGGVRTPAVGTP
jgi:hypothetical protein